MSMTDERLADLTEKNKIGRACLADPGSPKAFFVSYPDMVDELIGEVQRLRAAVTKERAECVEEVAALGATYTSHKDSDELAAYKKGYSAAIDDAVAAIRARGK